MSKQPNFASKVADHYNKVEQKPIRERAKSEIIELRGYNNSMKSLMHYLAFKFMTDRESKRVLDLGCGKGGDLQKYMRTNRIGFVAGVDIADVSIEQCKERFRDLNKHGKSNFKQPYGRRLDGKFFVADLTREDIRGKLREHNCDEKFDIAFSQFSIHYSFESFEQAVTYISNAANNLTKLGFFLGTYPDGPKLLKLARKSKTPGYYQVGDIMSVEFSPEDLENPKPFGTKYHFRLKEVVDCPEFLVHPEVLRSLMKSLGFFEVFDRSFEEQVLEMQKNPRDREEFKDIFEKHKGLQIDDDRKEARLSEEMWSVASVYRCFCYRKK